MCHVSNKSFNGLLFRRDYQITQTNYVIMLISVWLDYANLFRSHAFINISVVLVNWVIACRMTYGG